MKSGVYLVVIILKEITHVKSSLAGENIVLLIHPYNSLPINNHEPDPMTAVRSMSQ